MSGGGAPEHCHHYVIRKKRYCRIGVKPGDLYCGEHQPLSETPDSSNDNKLRITCPLDSKHTCYAHNLKKHLKICNARTTVVPPYIIKNCNKEGDEEPNKPLLSYSVEDVANVIVKIRKIYTDHISGKITENSARDKLVEDEMIKPDHGDKSKKHLTQASAILGLLSRYNLNQPNTCYIEFGAGRGLLSYWLAKSTEGNQSIFLLVERASPKHKQDNKLGKNEETVQRIRADIADLALDNVEVAMKSPRIVGITKHLCGEGTDLALKCLANTKRAQEKISGCLMTFCCHHRCRWFSYTGKDFFDASNLTREDFEMMCGISSWATCGTGFSRERNHKLDEEHLEADLNDRDKQLGLTRADKEELGRQAKNILNWGRVQYLEKLNFNCALHYYVEKEISLENVCIVAFRT